MTQLHIIPHSAGLSRGLLNCNPLCPLQLECRKLLLYIFSTALNNKINKFLVFIKSVKRCAECGEKNSCFQGQSVVLCWDYAETKFTKLILALKVGVILVIRLPFWT